MGALGSEQTAMMTLPYYNELQALDSHFRKRMEYRPGRGDRRSTARAHALSDDSTSTMARSSRGRAFTMLARGDEIDGSSPLRFRFGARPSPTTSARMDPSRYGRGRGMAMPGMARAVAADAAQLNRQNNEETQQLRAQAADARLVDG